MTVNELRQLIQGFRPDVNEIVGIAAHRMRLLHLGKAVDERGKVIRRGFVVGRKRDAGKGLDFVTEFCCVQFSPISTDVSGFLQSGPATGTLRCRQIDLLRQGGIGQAGIGLQQRQNFEIKSIKHEIRTNSRFCARFVRMVSRQRAFRTDIAEKNAYIQA